jgi:S-adenosylmethionine synthetase
MIVTVDGMGHPDEVTDRLVRTIDRSREPGR